SRKHVASLGLGERAGQARDQRDGVAPGERLILVLAEQRREQAIRPLADQPWPFTVAPSVHEPADTDPTERAKLLGRARSRLGQAPQLASVLAGEAAGLADRFEKTHGRGRAR